MLELKILLKYNFYFIGNNSYTNNFLELLLLVFWILLDLRYSISTDLNNYVSTSAMKSCNNFSTTTCLFWSKKNTFEKVFGFTFYEYFNAYGLTLWKLKGAFLNS